MSAQATEPEPLRVVIVDDTEDLRELLRFALIRGGMNVVGEAGDGLSGIEVVRDLVPDVILLDLSMPVMDGLEALPQMRAIVPDSRIIVLSGFGATQMSERAVAAGADGYIQKGASLGRILDHIRDVVDGHPAGPSRPRPAGLGPAPEIRDSFSLAPFGIIEIATEAPYKILRVNPAARELLGVELTDGVGLAEAAPELAATVHRNRLQGDIEFEATFAVQPVHVTLRHTGGSLVLYLRSISDEAGLLRKAIATTAHELRGPVSVLCGVAEAIAEAAEGEVDQDQHDRLMASVLRQAKMLDSITADLLTVAQVQRGTLRVDSLHVSPGAILDALAADRFPGSIAVEITDSRPVLADPLRLEQMLGNLLSNAHKYGGPPIVVRIRTSTEDQHRICIDVQDSGDGVPSDFRIHLFREFSRADGTEAAGTGLGLHVVQTLAQAQGGSVGYQPAPDGGSLFTLTMPAAKSPSD